MSKNEIKGKLKELGFSEYDLQKFRKTQRDFDVVKVDKQRAINGEIMGNKTHIPTYNYNMLYDLALNYPEMTPKEILGWIEKTQAITVEELKEETTTEIIETVKEVVKAINSYRGDIVEEEAIEVFKTHDFDEQVKAFMDFIWFLDFYYKYQESLKEGIEDTTIYDLRMRAERWIV